MMRPSHAPDEKRSRCIGSPEIVMAGSFDHEPQVVASSEKYTYSDVSSTARRYGVDTR